MEQHPHHEGQSIEFSGVFVKVFFYNLLLYQIEFTDSILQLQKDFFSSKEMTQLLASCDSMPWETSQSGRRKQVFLMIIS